MVNNKDTKKEQRFLDIMPKVLTPVMAIAGNHDVQCGEEAILRTLQALGSVRKRFVKVGDENVKYGHMDLLLGATARQDVFHYVSEWLKEADSGTWEQAEQEEEEEGKRVAEAITMKEEERVRMEAAAVAAGENDGADSRYRRTSSTWSEGI